MSMTLAFDTKMQKISVAVIGAYLLFFGFLYKLLLLTKSFWLDIGVGMQAILATFLMLGIHELIHKYQDIFPPFKNKGVTDMLQVYALICIIIALVSVNDIPKNLLELAP